jgi:glycine oxidase
VTVAARDPVERTASGVAAGMIAPALEAMNEPDPAAAYARLKAAQEAWRAIADALPQTLSQSVQASLTQGSDFIGGPEALARLRATGARVEPLGEGRVRVKGDGLIEAGSSLRALRAHLLASGGQLVTGSAQSVTRDSARMSDGGWLRADRVVIAAGYESHVFAKTVPSLACLTPIKGHLLEVAGTGGSGVVRCAGGYWARYDGFAKFGATMEAGLSDDQIDPERIIDLKTRAQALTPFVDPAPDLDAAEARVGVRAATPDGWPLIGRDAASGVLVATGMRRNGYVFAPLAAKILRDALAGRATDRLYDPDRFAR